MTALLLAVIPIVLGALFAGQVAVTRTGRLRKDILANLDLLGRLPAEHPNRAMLEAKNGDLLGVLARRQQRRYGPFTQAGVSFGALAGVAAVALVFAGFSALLAFEVIPSASAAASEPPTPEGQWAAMGFFLLIAGGCMAAAVRTARRQLKEHPLPAQQPTEAAASEGSA